MRATDGRELPVPNDIAARGTTRTRGDDVFGSLPRVLEVPLPWLVPMPSSQDLNVLGSVTSVAPSVGTEIPECRFQLGAGIIGVIRSFTTYITDMLTSTDVRYTLSVNGAPAPGFGRIKMFPVTASSKSNTFDCLIILPPAATISVFFTQTDGSTYNIGASYSGWVHTEAQARKWISAGPDNF